MAEIIKHGANLIHSIDVGGVVYEIHDASAIHEISELNLSGVLKFKGTVNTYADLPKEGNEAGDVYLVTDTATEYVWTEAGAWEEFGASLVNSHVHDYITANTTSASASKIVTTGSVSVGTAPTFIEGAFSGGSFEAGKDEFTAGSVTVGAVTADYTAPTYTQGTDTFNAGSHTVVDTSKFDGGKIDYVAPSMTECSVSFTQGTDKFTANTPTKIDTTKFSGGSMTAGSVTAGAVDYTPGTCEQKVEGGVLSFICTPGTMVYTAPVYTAPQFTAATIQDGFYEAGSAASFEQGTDSHTFTAGTFNAGSMTHTPAQIQAGFYTPGVEPTFVQGTDSFTAGNVTVTQAESTYVAPTFKQGEDKFTPATREAATFNAGTATTVELPTFTSVDNLWQGTKDVSTGLPEAPAN